jgi:hypothetical protein
MSNKVPNSYTKYLRPLVKNINNHFESTILGHWRGFTNILSQMSLDLMWSHPKQNKQNHEFKINVFLPTVKL